ncbi:MAG: DNA polymerase III subunit delta' [Clostridia bacterium]|nr:DNA polymerase III subunit delta' [Clostridia bacterium]
MAEMLENPGVPSLSDFAGQGALYEGMMRTLRDGTFVHAYLISGPEGIGKRTLARLMAQHLLCTGVEKPCGVCPSCQQVADGNHPDVIIERPGEPLCPDVERGRKLIPVAEMRYLLGLVGQHTFAGGRRIVIIEQADRMNPQAANALLKTLEEPMDGTIFLLLTDAPELLLDTIVSRCRAMKLHPWEDAYILKVIQHRGVSRDMAERAVAACGGSIGRALSIAADEDFWKLREEVLHDFLDLPSRGEILRVSNAWKERKDDADALLSALEDMIRTLLLVRLGRQSDAMIRDYPPEWRNMAASAELAAFIRLLDAVCDVRRLRLSQVTWQAALEKLLLRMMEEKSKWST